MEDMINQNDRHQRKEERLRMEMEAARKGIPFIEEGLNEYVYRF